MRKSWNVLLAAVLGFTVMYGAALAAEEPVFTGCICFDPTDSVSRQEARDECDDVVAADYRAGVLQPPSTALENPCADAHCMILGAEAWPCFGVGGPIGGPDCPPNC